MRNTIFTFIGVALLVGFVACDDWTSPEKLDVENEAVGDLYSKRDSIKWAEEEKRHKRERSCLRKIPGEPESLQKHQAPHYVRVVNACNRTERENIPACLFCRTAWMLFRYGETGTL